MEEWTPEKTTVQVCLTFDEANFFVNNPHNNDTLEAHHLISHTNLDLSRSVIDAIRVVSTEKQMGGNKQDSYPCMFFLKLFADGTLINHDIKCSTGHPIGDNCTAKNYFQRVSKNAKEKMLTDFGHYTNENNKKIFEMYDQSGNTGNSKKERSAFSRKLISYRSVNIPETEKGSQPMANDTDLQFFEEEIAPNVQRMFMNITNITGKIAFIGNEQATLNDHTVPLLMRVVLEIDLRANRIK